LRSKKAEVAQRSAETETGRLTTTSLATPMESTVNTVMLGEGVAAAGAVVDMLIELGLA
jgi:hypothetical protein